MFTHTTHKQHTKSRTGQKGNLETTGGILSMIELMFNLWNIHDISGIALVWHCFYSDVLRSSLKYVTAYICIFSILSSYRV